VRDRRGHPVLAAVIDPFMAPLARHREVMVPRAAGEVMELGAGTGMNFALYDPARVRSVVAVEPDPYMLRRAVPRAEAAPVPVTLVDADGAALPFEDASFDDVVCTWVLCTIPDAAAAVAEVRRVLRPGGRLLFVEHVISPRAPMRTLQHAIDPVWTRCAGGCHLDRDTIGLLQVAGFSRVEVEPAPRVPWGLVPMVRGVAYR
jgi:ubiquinone/menaquinone biosynthesis C-methylase UbiE